MNNFNFNFIVNIDFQILWIVNLGARFFWLHNKCMYAGLLVARDVLGEIYLALEDDSPIESIIWLIWMINENLGSVSFKLYDLKNDTEPN